MMKKQNIGLVYINQKIPSLKSGYPFSPGHYATSITYHEDLMALPGQGQRIDLR